MYEFNSTTSYIIYALIAIVIAGVYYNLVQTTKLYGGIIGQAVRLIGVATLCIAIASINNVLLKFNVIRPSLPSSIFQDLLIVISLILLGLAFSKLASVSKQ